MVGAPAPERRIAEVAGVFITTASENLRSIGLQRTNARKLTTIYVAAASAAQVAGTTGQAIRIIAADGIRSTPTIVLTEL